ncbi:MAG: tyrosine-type recombinase/integrase [Clostridia bacterium]|nr:tyrosine-type recombinase/integrase [Clostridia bacterium]
MEIILSPDVLARFRKTLAADEKSDATAGKYLHAARDFAGFLSGRAVTRDLALEYKNTVLERKYAPKSVNVSVAALNSLFAFLGLSGCRLKAMKIQKRVFADEKAELTETEYHRLVDAAHRMRNGRLALILATICATGIRVSELKFITVEAARRGEATVTNKGKTRAVLIPRELQKKLLKYAQKRKITAGAIFVTRGGKPVDRTNVWREMKKLCAAARVDPAKVFPHNLRRLFARKFYNLEKDIAKLADLLGHSSIDTTRIYIMSTRKAHRKQIERMRLVC